LNLKPVNMNSNRSAALILFALGHFATGCGEDSSDEHAAPAGSGVKIVSTSPDRSEALKRGDVVKLQAEVEYQLNTDSGTLSLVIQESDTSTISVQTEVVTRGNGTDTKSVLLFAPLTGQGQTKTSTVDTLAFRLNCFELCSFRNVLSRRLLWPGLKVCHSLRRYGARKMRRSRYDRTENQEQRSNPLNGRRRPVSPLTLGRHRLAVWSTKRAQPDRRVATRPSGICGRLLGKKA
jgi:hypothetical protein